MPCYLFFEPKNVNRIKKKKKKLTKSGLSSPVKSVTY